MLQKKKGKVENQSTTIQGKKCVWRRNGARKGEKVKVCRVVGRRSCVCGTGSVCSAMSHRAGHMAQNHKGTGKGREEGEGTAHPVPVPPSRLHRPTPPVSEPTMPCLSSVLSVVLTACSWEPNPREGSTPTTQVNRTAGRGRGKEGTTKGAGRGNRKGRVRGHSRQGEGNPGSVKRGMREGRRRSAEKSTCQNVRRDRVGVWGSGRRESGNRQG